MKSTGKNPWIGVIGVGTMGRHHVRIISQNPNVTLSGLFDPDVARAQEICTRYGCLAHGSIDELLDKSDAVCVAAPTSLHLEIGLKCIHRGLHVLMEKPLADTAIAATQLVTAAEAAGVVLMVGHIERYNPAILKMMEILKESKEQVVSVISDRLAPFDGSRCMDVDVLHDLMIHDIDIVLEIADSAIARVHATGRPVFSLKTDIAHTVLEFENHVIATIWTAKCSPKKVRTTTVTTRRHHMVADTLSRSLAVCTADGLPEMANGVCLMNNIRTESVTVPDEEPLKQELEDFFQAIQGGTPPLVDGHRGLAALKALELVSAAMSNGDPV
jgi:predicted dehydrogenase